MQARNQWMSSWSAWNIKNCQSRILFLAKISFEMKIKIKTFSSELKLNEFVASTTYRNVESFSNWRKIMPGGISELEEKLKRAINDKYVSKNSHLLISLSFLNGM